MQQSLSTAQLAERGNFVRQFHLRSVNTESREFVGIALPYEEDVEIFGLWKERHARNAVEDSDDAKVFWDHQEVIGKIRSNRNLDGGWEVVGHVSKTQRGDEALTLMADGAADGLSVWFDPIEHRVEEDGTVVFTRERVLEVSITPFPQYPSARGHRRAAATPNQEAPSMTDQTPPVTEPPATPLAPSAPTAVVTPDALDEALSTQRSDMERTLDARLAKLGSAPQQRSALPWSSSGAFIKAIANGDEAAIDFHRNWNDRSDAGEEFRRAYTGGTSADGTGRKTWVGEAIRLVDKQRKVINRFQRKPLPEEGMTLEYAKILSNTVAVAKQAAEGDDLAKGKVTVTTDTADVETYGGWSEMSLQQVKRSNVDFVSTTQQAQEIEYAKQTEAAVRAFLLAEVVDRQAGVAGTNFVPVGVTPALFDYFDGIVDAADLFEQRGFNIDGAYASKATFKTLYRLADASNRMVFNVYGTGSNQVGELSLKGLNGELANVRVELLTGAPTKFFTFYDELAITTWEEPGAPLKLQDENIINLTKAFSSHGEIAYGSQYPDAIIPLKFVAP
jgi:uncharacterized protein